MVKAADTHHIAPTLYVPQRYVKSDRQHCPGRVKKAVHLIPGSGDQTDIPVGRSPRKDVGGGGGIAPDSHSQVDKKTTYV